MTNFTHSWRQYVTTKLSVPKLLAALLCTLLLLAPAVFLNNAALKARNHKASISIEELERSIKLANHFKLRYSKIAAIVRNKTNTRIRWAEALQALRRDYTRSELTFSISDPVRLPVILSGGESSVLLTESLIRISALLANDRGLMSWLEAIQSALSDVVRNRSCSVTRIEGAKPLKLDCIYSVLQIDLTGGL